MCEQGMDSALVKLFHKNDKGHTYAPVDGCIVEIVQALNNCGLQTHASCCGHGKRPGIISLNDGRELIICPDYESARIAEKAFPPLHPA